MVWKNFQNQITLKRNAFKYPICLFVFAKDQDLSVWKLYFNLLGRQFAKILVVVTLWWTDIIYLLKIKIYATN